MICNHRIYPMLTFQPSIHALKRCASGGTASISITTDKNQETDVSAIYVADASVLPLAPGAPPILTMVALAKYVSRIIAG